MGLGFLTPGAVVAGYRIESIVGRGGMGVVYRARELELDRVVALKVIAPELLEDQLVRERFLKEARTAASIEHPNVIPVYAAGERDGIAYIVMRFIDGDDVRTLVRRDGPLGPGGAADMAGQAGIGLDAIHRAGYVHRDVKPANVLVDKDGHVYVTDFGLAKQVISQGGATATGRWVGTLDYVAPEQIRGGRVDARADVYALGGVLSFMLTGRVPFEREGDEAKLWAQLSEPPPVPSRLRSGLPRELDAVVARAMAKDPEARYLSAGDLGRAARAAASGGRPSQPERMVARGAAAPAGALTEPGIAGEASTVTATRPQPARPRRRRGLVAIAAAGVLAAGAFAVTLALTSADDRRWNAARAGDPAASPRPDRTPAPHMTETIRGVGHRPNAIAIANGDLWITSADDPGVTRIDMATRRERRQHPDVGRGARSLASDGTSVWVAVKTQRRLVRIDARTGRVTMRLDPGAEPSRVVVGLGSVWLAAKSGPPRQGLIIRYDRSGRELDRTVLPGVPSALAAGAGFVWVTLEDDIRLLRLNPRTGGFVVWTKLSAPGSALSYGAGYVWATLISIDSIARISPYRAGSVPTGVGNSPAQSVAAGGHVFVAVNTDHVLRLVNPRTARVVGAPVPVALNPYALAADDQAVWATGLGNTVSRIAYR